MLLAGKKFTSHKHHNAHVEVDGEMKIGHELTTLTPLSDEEPHPSYDSKKVKEMKKEVQEYQSSGRYKFSDKLQNYFQVKHW